MSETSKLRRRLRRMVKRDEPLTQGQERAFLRLMRVAGAGIGDEQIAQMRLTEPRFANTEASNG